MAKHDKVLLSCLTIPIVLVVLFVCWFFISMTWGMRTRIRETPTERDMAIVCSLLDLQKMDKFRVARFKHIFAPGMTDSSGAAGYEIVLPKTFTRDLLTSWTSIEKNPGIPFSHRSSLIEWFYDTSLPIEKGYEREIQLGNVLKEGESHIIGVSYPHSGYAFRKVSENGDSHYFILLPWELYKDWFFFKL